MSTSMYGNVQAAEGGGSSFVGSGLADPATPDPGTRPDGHQMLGNMKKLLHGDPAWCACETTTSFSKVLPMFVPSLSW